MLKPFGFMRAPHAAADSNAIVFLAADADVASGDVTTVTAVNAADFSMTQTNAALKPSIASGLITFDGADELLTQSDDRIPQEKAKTVFPDGASSGEIGEGFTATGIAKLPDGRWAVGNFGLPLQGGGGTQASSIVLLSSDFSTISAEYLTSSYTGGVGTAAVQGVCVDDAGNVWFANKQAQLLICMNPADGSEVDTLSLAYEPNGLGWDSLVGELVVQDQATNTLRWINKVTGTQSQTKAIPADCDHIFFDAGYGSEGAIWFTSATSNAVDGEVEILDVASGDIAAFHSPFENAKGIEGVHYDRDARRLYIVCNAYYHAGTTQGNAVYEYDVMPPLGPTYAFFFSGRALSNPGAAAVIVGYGLQKGKDTPASGLYHLGGTTNLRFSVSNTGTNSNADFTLATLTTDADYWVHVDLTSGVNGEASLYIDGVLQQTVGLSVAPDTVLKSGDQGLYVGGVVAGDVGDFVRHWNGELRAWGVSLNTANRAAVEGLY